MSIEIERKFLVRDDSWREGIVRTTPIRQGYLCTETGRSVRVRMRDDEAWLTVKGSLRGFARPEYEYSVPLRDGLEMLEMTVATLDKRRHEVPHGAHVWEVDEFDGPNALLIVAEVELSAIDEAFEHPPWLGEDESENSAYSNSALAQHPYSTWSDA
ncbi:hypothetical protein BUMB_04613c [Candidatus Paraburkholderia calva]|nr:hypothetical protein BUMB_04613c [Candidatus Paraburkholderia calva]